MSIEVGALIGSLITVLGLVLSYWNYRRLCKRDEEECQKNIKNGAKEEAVKDGELKSDINYIKRGVEDIRVDMRAQEVRFNQLSDRVTRCEESNKSAHKRLDTVEGKI